MTSSVPSHLSVPCSDLPWRLLRLPPLSDPAGSLTREDALLARVMAGESGPLAVISRHPRCLVATRREARWPDFAAVGARLAAEGWPVVVRCSGGSCVPQGPGVLNLALIFARPAHWRLEDGYRLLCDLLTAWLDGFGVHAGVGEVAGAFCDGRYNVQVGGCKLAGTAQRWAGSNRRRSVVLAHACLLVDPDLEEMTRQVNRFYALCGQQRRFDPEACTSLRRCLRWPAAAAGDFMAEAESRLVEVLAERFAVDGLRRQG
ncbi:lipoate-protein ligase A [Geothermobacter ehrlichii]|uniref:Lipoate-protein ligase A n=1 Tax=Geothermobacter ehrlichii TaxID=213224 RepID=A0A5D3WJB3_9BACT|nr:protein ligase [Geothermobacter ehrlichii]TYO97612.1 lipoate-protein ligase A [Geothermobacter ehrlichii]